MAFDLSPSQHGCAEETYFASPMRVPRYRFGTLLSLTASTICLLSKWEVLTAAVLVSWGIGATGWILWDLMRAYARAKRSPRSVA